MKIKLGFITLIGALYLVSGCTSVNTFGLAARQGDTIAVALGWQQELTSQNIQVTVTDSSNNVTFYPPNDPAIRAVFNAYPDPVSNLIVGAESGQPNIGGTSAGTATSLIDFGVTGLDKDYLQTFLLLDLPPSMTEGTAKIRVRDSFGNPIPNPSVYSTAINDIDIKILPVTEFGESNTFATQEGILISNYLSAFERAPHNTVTLSGDTVPYAVEMVLSHDLDASNHAYVVNPRGDLKNINWAQSADDRSLKIIILPARAQALAGMEQFKFYVAGGITNLSLVSVAGYGVDGALIPVTDPITVTIN